MSSSRTHAAHRRLPSTSPEDIYSPSAQAANPPIPLLTPPPANGHGLPSGEDWKAMASSTAQLVSPPQEHDLSTEEYDDGGAAGFDDDAEEGTITGVPAPEKKWKGKAKEVEGDEVENGLPSGIDTLSYAEIGTGVQSYPPLSDEAQEERQVAENLKRWEQLERQRRKAARDRTRDRDSTFSLSGPGWDVTRRASLILKGRGGRGGAKGDRSSVQSQASDRPLRPAAGAAGGDSEMGILGEPTSPSTGSTGRSFRSSQPDRESTSHDNPFSRVIQPPPSAREDRFSLPYNTGIKATPFRLPSGAYEEMHAEDPFSSRSSLEQIDIQSGSGSSLSHQQRQSHPPPYLGSHFHSHSHSHSSHTHPHHHTFSPDDAKHLPTLPETSTSPSHPASALQPHTPFPPDIHWNSPNSSTALDLKSTNGFSISESLDHDGTDIGDRDTLEDGDGTQRRRRWWMDWLCGCGNEEDDDDQAGRTNPFE